MTAESGHPAGRGQRSKGSGEGANRLEVSLARRLPDDCQLIDLEPTTDGAILVDHPVEIDDILAEETVGAAFQPELRDSADPLY